MRPLHESMLKSSDAVVKQTEEQLDKTILSEIGRKEYNNSGLGCIFIDKIWKQKVGILYSFPSKSGNNWQYIHGRYSNVQ